MKKHLGALLTLISILIICFQSGNAAIMPDQGFSEATNALGDFLGTVKPYQNNNDVFGQLNSKDFDTSKASLLAFFNVPENYVIVIGRLEGKNSYVASWTDLDKTNVAQAGELFLSQYESIDVQSSGNVLVIIDSENEEYICRNQSEADSLLSVYDAKLGIAKQNVSKAQAAQVLTKSNINDTTPSRSAQAYIGNRNTKKFHYPSCSSVSKMKDSNKVILNSRDEAIDKGYVPCKNCNP